MFNFLLLLGFFGAFIGPIGMLSYLCMIRSYKVKFGLFDSLFILFIITVLLVNLLSSDVVLSVMAFRFYFGFLCFYIYFKSGETLPIKNILLLLIFLVPFEAILINTFISPYDMPNFPSAEARGHFNIGGYQRPYSFGGNSSVSSSVFVILLSMISISKVRKYAAIGTVFIFSSGSGLMSLVLLILLKKIRQLVIYAIFISIFIVMFHSIIIDFVDSLGLKVNSKYIYYLIEFKFGQFKESFDGFSTVNYLFGNIDSLKNGYGGDFGWLHFVKGYGFFTWFLLLSFILSKATQETVIPLLIGLFATMHYPVIFFLPGQIILGYLMARKYRDTGLTHV